jgi:hypothetical protein
MLKLIVAATLLGSVSTLAAIPVSDSPLSMRPAFKTDRVETSTSSAARNFLSPKIDGKPVAFCLSGDSQCGKAAADAFCRSAGYNVALTFQRDGMQSELATLHFREIKCAQPKVAVDASHGMANDKAGISLSNATAKSDRL